MHQACKCFRGKTGSRKTLTGKNVVFFRVVTQRAFEGDRYTEEQALIFVVLGTRLSGDGK